MTVRQKIDKFDTTSDLPKLTFKDKLNEVIKKVNSERIGDEIEGVIEYIPGREDAKETIRKIITRNYPQNKE